MLTPPPPGGDSYQNGYQQQNQYYQQDYGYDQSGYNGLYYAPQDPVVVAAYALTQIEYYFSLENLCRDVFLRSRLDSGGYIPVTMILTFNRVAAANPEYDAMLKVLETSELLELDSENEKIRLKTGWEQVRDARLAAPAAHPNRTLRTHTQTHTHARKHTTSLPPC